MYSKFTLPLWAIIILLTSGCQNSKAISVSPISTPAVIASPVKSLVPKTGTGEPIAVGSPEIVETFPVSPPLSEPSASASEIAPKSATTPTVSSEETIASSSSTLTSSPTQPAPIYTPYHTPTRMPIQTAIHTALQEEVEAEQGWLTYTDPVLRLFFQYPPEWEITETKPGVFVRFLQDERGHFIYLTIRENPDSLSPSEYLIKEMLQSHTDLTKTAILPDIKQFSRSGFDGAVYQEKDSNVKTRIIVTCKGITIRISLRIRGEIGWGVTPSSDYNSTEQEIFKLITSLQLPDQ